MPSRAWLSVLGYGALAAALLACLWLVSLAPLRFQWGRELTGAAVAIVAMVLGLRLARRPPSAQAMTPAPAASPPRAAAAPSDAIDPDTPLLSVREREVLRLLAQGLSNKELARALSVSENTVKTHLANLYAKLGVGRRTEALAAARRLGIDG